MILHAVVTVQLARSDFTVEEGSGSVAVQLTKSGQTASSFSVLLTTTNGSAEGKGLSEPKCKLGIVCLFVFLFFFSLIQW